MTWAEPFETMNRRNSFFPEVGSVGCFGHSGDTSTDSHLFFQICFLIFFQRPRYWVTSSHGCHSDISVTESFMDTGLMQLPLTHWLPHLSQLPRNVTSQTTLGVSEWLSIYMLSGPNLHEIYTSFNKFIWNIFIYVCGYMDMSARAHMMIQECPVPWSWS